MIGRIIMRLGYAALALAILSGCSSVAEKAEKQYEMMKRGGASEPELCRQARVIRDAYLQAGNEERYKYQMLISDVECFYEDHPSVPRPY